ncbi:MAG: DUF72 domain-containing protein [Candidatus Verstraetearchaeota archaeon]|nr:DUF72 domain-containing protein [Candidatus Verstraetearchaeota archaeon]
MEVYVGTSGWMYIWNPDGFDWYLVNSKLNAVELNASFYRFPFPSMVKSWASKSRGKLRWAVKVSRWVTHVFKLSERAYSTWMKFRELFKPLDDIVDFYLFQLPPQAAPTESFVRRLEKFYRNSGLEERFALEWRNLKWFLDKKWVKWAEELGLTLVSVDSPEHPRDSFCVNGIVYLRMHGREAWYAHYYEEEELIEVAEKIKETSPEKVYVFFNNNHAMLENAQRMLEILG